LLQIVRIFPPDEVLPNPPLSRVYEPDPDFRLRFSSRLAIHVCRRLCGGTVEATRVVADVKQRLDTTAAIVEWLLRKNRDAEKAFLRLAKKPFQFQDRFDPIAPTDLDVLQAQELLEGRSAMMQTLVELALPSYEGVLLTARFYGQTIRRHGAGN
jgi:hypothetical protein